MYEMAVSLGIVGMQTLRHVCKISDTITPAGHAADPCLGEGSTYTAASRSRMDGSMTLYKHLR
jgi:hypothetical protein